MSSVHGRSVLQFVAGEVDGDGGVRGGGGARENEMEVTVLTPAA